MTDLPSVTQILSPWADFSKVRPDVLERACARGSAVHEACDVYANGLWVTHNKEIQGWVDSFTDWFDKTVLTVWATEVELIHKALGFKGHPDLIAQLKGDKNPSLIEIKTPATKSRVWRLQLAGYLWLSREIKGTKIQRVMSLRLRKSGKIAILDEYTQTQSEDMMMFINCLNAWKYFHQKEVTRERI